MRTNKKTKDWYVIEEALDAFLRKNENEEARLMQEYEDLCKICGKTVFTEDQIDYMFSHMTFCSRLVDSIGNALICMQLFNCFPEKYLNDALYICRYTKETKGYSEEKIINILTNKKQ